VTLEFAPQRTVTLRSWLRERRSQYALFSPGSARAMKRRLRRRRSESAERRIARPDGSTVTADLRRSAHSHKRDSPVSVVDKSRCLRIAVVDRRKPARVAHLHPRRAWWGAVAMVVLPPQWAPSIASTAGFVTFACLRWSCARSVLSPFGHRMPRRRRRGHGLRSGSPSLPGRERLAAHFETAGVLASIAVVALRPT